MGVLGLQVSEGSVLRLGYFGVRQGEHRTGGVCKGGDCHLLGTENEEDTDTFPVTFQLSVSSN